VKIGARLQLLRENPAAQVIDASGFFADYTGIQWRSPILGHVPPSHNSSSLQISIHYVLLPSKARSDLRVQWHPRKAADGDRMSGAAVWNRSRNSQPIAVSAVIIQKEYISLDELNYVCDFADAQRKWRGRRCEYHRCGQPSRCPVFIAERRGK